MHLVAFIVGRLAGQVFYHKYLKRKFGRWFK